MAGDDADVDVQKIPAGHHALERVAVRPIGRARVLPEGLEFAEATRAPRADVADVDGAARGVIFAVGVAIDDVAADLVEVA